MTGLSTTGLQLLRVFSGAYGRLAVATVTTRVGEDVNGTTQTFVLVPKGARVGRPLAVRGINMSTFNQLNLVGNGRFVITIERYNGGNVIGLVLPVRNYLHNRLGAPPLVVLAWLWTEFLFVLGPGRYYGNVF